MNLESAIKIIKEFEGLKLSAYICPAGKPTIGYGHTKNVKIGMRISEDKAEEFLSADLDDIMPVIGKVKVPLNENQYNALVSFIFNFGGKKFLSSTMFKLLNTGAYKEAAEQFDKWIYADGKKSNGLIRRRRAEKNLFLME